MDIRRSTNWWVIVVVVALIASGCGSDSPEQPRAGEPAVATTAPIAESATATLAPTVAADVAVATPRPTANDDPDATAGPRSDALINWSDAGVTIFDTGGTTLTVTTMATSYAVLFDSGLAVYQTSPYAIAIGDDETELSVVAAPGRELRLLAGQYIDSEPMVLVASRVEMPVGPEDAEDRLFLIDVRTGGRRDLGVIGGWEGGVGVAQFGNESIAMVRSIAAQNALIFVDLNGQIFETIQLQTEGDYVPAVRSGGAEVALLRPFYDEDSSRPGLLVWTAAIEQGATLERGEHLLTLDGIELDGSFCRLASYTNDGTILCDRSTGSPIEIDPQDSYRATAIEGMTSGAAAPAIRREDSIQPVTPLPDLEPVLREIGATADGRFRYFVAEVPYQKGPILVDDGSGLRPATNDPRDQFRLSFDPLESDLTFLDERTVTWRSASTGTSWPTYIGRVTEDGMIIDVAGAYVEEADGGLARYQVSAVMSSGRDLDINIDQQLVPLMPEPGRPAGPSGGLYSGVTLAATPACGGRTLYRTTYDGFGRVLYAHVEIAPVTAAFETETHDGANYDSVWIERHLALATSCPQEHQGVRLHLATESIGYGDGDNGPRGGPSMGLWTEDGIVLPDGTREFSEIVDVTMIGLDCQIQAVVVVDVVDLNGEPHRLRIQRHAGDQPMSVERVSPQTTLQPSTTKSLCLDE